MSASVVSYTIVFNIIDMTTSDTIFLNLCFSAIAFIIVFIFLKGQTKGIQNQPLYTLVAISLKFMLDMAMALIWFTVIKKTGITSVILFFVLYLSFTLFTVWVILNTLKNKAL